MFLVHVKFVMQTNHALWCCCMQELNWDSNKTSSYKHAARNFIIQYTKPCNLWWL